MFKLRSYPSLLTLLLGISLLAIPHVKGTSTESNKKTISVFFNGVAFTKDVSDYDTINETNLIKNAFEYFEQQDTFKSLLKYWSSSNFWLFNQGQIFNEGDDIDTTSSLQLVLVHNDNQNDYENYIFGNSSESTQFQNKGPRTNKVCVFFNQETFIDDLNNWDNEPAKGLKTIALTYFEDKIHEHLSNDDFTLYNYDFEYDDRTIYENENNDDLQLVLIHKSEKKRYVKLCEENSNNFTNFQNDFDALSNEFNNDDLKENTLNTTINPEERPLFFVYFKHKKQTLEVPRDLNNTVAGDLIWTFFKNIPSYDQPIRLNGQQNEINELIESYKLLSLGENNTLLSCDAPQHLKNCPTIQPHSQWAIVPTTTTTWDPSFIQEHNRENSHEPEEKIHVYETSNNIHNNHNSFSVFFNQKEYQIPPDLQEKNVQEIMTYVLSQAPRPFNTIHSNFFCLATTVNNDNKEELVIKDPSEEPINHTRRQWVAVDKRTTTEFTNWAIKDDYFDLHKNDEYSISVDPYWDDIKNYINIYPQYKGRISQPLPKNFIDTDNNFIDIPNLILNYAYELFNTYTTWQDNNNNQPCPITVMAGLNKLNIESLNNWKNIFKIKNMKYFIDFNEFHIIKTQNISAFCTLLYKKYNNSHKKNPIKKKHLRISVNHKYADIELLKIDVDTNDELLNYYKEQALYKALNHKYDSNKDLFTLMLGKTNLDTLSREQGHEELKNHLQEGKLLTLIPGSQELLFQSIAYNNIQKVDSILDPHVDGDIDNVNNNGKKHTAIAGSLAVVLALISPSESQKNKQPSPIGGPKDSILIKVTTHAAQ